MNRMMSGKFYILWIYFVLVSFLACNRDHSTFNTHDWGERDGNSYPYREAMVKDLLMNHLKDGMSESQIAQLLGAPDHIEMGVDKTLWYAIESLDNQNGEPKRMKTLFISLHTDSTIKASRIEEWTFAEGRKK